MKDRKRKTQKRVKLTDPHLYITSKITKKLNINSTRQVVTIKYKHNNTEKLQDAKTESIKKRQKDKDRKYIKKDRKMNHKMWQDRKTQRQKINQDRKELKKEQKKEQKINQDRKELKIEQKKNKKKNKK